mmetsp:Transcript_45903/g.130094  ORF Transcript_45903/g.130094 Transcript_45903/m.130094 type:complete len:343 (-) Transcript_45903:226-1254(-)
MQAARLSVLLLFCLSWASSESSAATADLRVGDDVPEALLEQDDACHGSSDAEGRCDVSLLQRRGRVKQHAEAQLAEVPTDANKEHQQVAQAAAEASKVMDTSLLQDRAEANATSGANMMTLFHQTSEAAGKSILASGKFYSGKSGICGGAIYFSPSAKDTDVKVVGGRGFVIEAQVDMGRIKTMSPYCDEAMTGAKLLALGFDSITLDRGYMFECFALPSCKEYIIYDAARIKSMKGYPYNGIESWWPSWMPPWMKPTQPATQAYTPPAQTYTPPAQPPAPSPAQTYAPPAMQPHVQAVAAPSPPAVQPAVAVPLPAAAPAETYAPPVEQPQAQPVAAPPAM